MILPIRIASRSSPLALVQIDEIIQELKAQGVSLEYQLIQYQTAGDKDKTTPLTGGRDDFFTDTLDKALLESKADIAIHSAKDLPRVLPENLKIFALTKGLEDKDAWVSPWHWQDLPLYARVGTSSILRQAQILALRPDLTIVQIRGTIQERLALIEQGKVDGVIVALCALKRLQLESRVMDILPWEGMALQGQLAVVGHRDNRVLEDIFSVLDVRRQYGAVTLVGAGPGDPDLITLKGVKALQAADCVFYDYLVDANLLKYASHAEHIYVGKRKGVHAVSQLELSRMLKDRAIEGKRVVRLKGGDPLIFGRGADEIQYLRAYHIHVDVIPGISSATGILSSLGVPLTARGVASSVALLSAHGEDEDKNPIVSITIPEADTLIFLMGLTKLNVIVSSLRKSGWPQDTLVMIIANGTKVQEQIVRGSLATIENLVKAADLKSPALIAVGKTMAWYQPKFRKTFLHCGTHPDSYQSLGRIVPWPMIKIEPVVMSQEAQKDVIKAFEAADIVICTSTYAAEYLMRILGFVRGRDKIFAVIGEHTASVLRMHQIEPTIVAREETAQGLFKAIDAKISLMGKRILFPRSSLPNPFLKEALSAKGALVDEVTVYTNTKPKRRDLPQQSIDGVIFTSPSTVRHFLEDYGKIPPSWQILAKGPVTLKTVQDAGYVCVTALS